jgi:hypothetical protein
MEEMEASSSMEKITAIVNSNCIMKKKYTHYA